MYAVMQKKKKIMVCKLGNSQWFQREYGERWEAIEVSFHVNDISSALCKR